MALEGDCGHDFDHGAEGHGHSLGDLMFGLELGMGYAGHSLSVADAAALSLAMQIAFEPGASQQQGYATGHVPDASGVSRPAPHAPEAGYIGSDPDETPALPGITSDATTIKVVCWPHRRRDRSMAAEVQLLAKAAGLESYLPRYTPGLVNVQRQEPRILPIAAIGGPRDRDKMPDGWYAGATGTTDIWRECFHIRRWRLPFFQRPESYERHRTFLIVTGATWHYRERDDYETRVAFTVYSLPFSLGASWTYRWDQISEHRQAAQRVALRLYELLS